MLRATITDPPACAEERRLRRLISCDGWPPRNVMMSMYKIRDTTGEGDDLPPTTLHNIWFWTCQVLYWIGVAILTLIFVPWALVVHLALGALAIPFAPALYYPVGRKVFIYVYVLTVMMPGKYIWFNAWLNTKRRGKVWDYEMGKPRAVPPDRHRLSFDNNPKVVQQDPNSSFLFKLPAEVRLQIYKEVFVGGSLHLHITTRRTKESRTSPPDIKVRGYLCNRKHTDEKFASCACMIGSHAHHDPPTAEEVKLDPRHGNGRIAMLQSCRQVYAESINLMYSSPTFCFNNLEQPPFFILAGIPARLSQIQNIQLCWKQVTMSRVHDAGSSLTRYVHRIGQCSFCNLSAWLKLVNKQLTGLRTVEMFMYLDKNMAIPSLGHSWIADLLKLQRKPDGTLRQLQITVFCNNDDFTMPLQSDYKKAMTEFTQKLAKQVRKNQLRDSLSLFDTVRAGTEDHRASGALSPSSTLSSTLSSESGFIDGSGVIGPLRSALTPDDAFWG